MTWSQAAMYSCDEPSCEVTVFVPSRTTATARANAMKLEWTFVRWLRRGSRGSGRMICLCPTHASWRPDDDGREGRPWISWNARKKVRR